MAIYYGNPDQKEMAAAKKNVLAKPQDKFSTCSFIKNVRAPQGEKAEHWIKKYPTTKQESNSSNQYYIWPNKHLLYWINLKFHYSS